MGRTYGFTCDGCGRKHESREHGLPTCWGELTISVEGYTNWRSGGSKSLSLTALLCPACQIRHQDTVQPMTWPRTGAV